MHKVRMFYIATAHYWHERLLQYGAQSQLIHINILIIYIVISTIIVRNTAFCVLPLSLPPARQAGGRTWRSSLSGAALASQPAQ